MPPTPMQDDPRGLQCRCTCGAKECAAGFPSVHVWPAPFTDSLDHESVYQTSMCRDYIRCAYA